MDFISDMEAVARAELDQHGIDHSSAMGWKVMHLLLNVQMKLIKQVQRNVEVSKKIQNSLYDDATKKNLAAIEDKFHMGNDVNPHLSKGILNGTYTDALFSDWGIYHLHLNTNTDAKDSRFVKRSGPVLFLTLSGDIAYFVNVRSHDPKIDPNVWEQKDLLQTIADEWPWVIEPYKLKGAVGIKDEIDDPQEIKKMRKGVNVFHKINGAIYAPPGGGLTTASTSMRVTMRANQLSYLARNAEKYIVENRPQIDEFLSKIEGYNPRDARFRLGLNSSGFLIYEETTNTKVFQLKE